MDLFPCLSTVFGEDEKGLIGRIVNTCMNADHFDIRLLFTQLLLSLRRHLVPH